MMPPVFGIVGWKNHGKTYLTVRLVEELTRRGYRVATVKHAHHDFDIDHEGTDSWRHRQAGACAVAVVSSRRLALIHELTGEEEPSLIQVVDQLPPCDLVLVEGYKLAAHDKLEVRRQNGREGEALYMRDPHIVAIASDVTQKEVNLPFFDINAIAEIADFIVIHLQLKAGNEMFRKVSISN